MGFSTMIDLVGAALIGGTLLLTLYQVNEKATITVYHYNEEFGMQGEILLISNYVEGDFRRIGYAREPSQMPDPSKAISAAGEFSIRIKGDFDNDNDVDSITYYLGPTSEMEHTRNPYDRILYRRFNTSEPMVISASVTHFRLKYYDALRDSISLPILDAETGRIQNIEVSVRVESPEILSAYGDNTGNVYDDYATAFWRQKRITSRNLKNR